MLYTLHQKAHSAQKFVFMLKNTENSQIATLMIMQCVLGKKVYKR